MDRWTDFATALRGLRTSRGLTLEALARKAGTGKGYLSCAERRKMNPPSARITRRLAKALGIATEELLIYAYAEKAPMEIRDMVLSGALREFSERSLFAHSEQAS